MVTTKTRFIPNDMAAGLKNNPATLEYIAWDLWGHRNNALDNKNNNFQEE
jgi:hypothetical protein